MEYTELEIELAMKAHSCTREEAISTYCASVKAARDTQAKAISAIQYQRDRAQAYPPITDYLDGVVKGDQAQIDAYIAACKAVKDKYPKPQ